MASRGRRQATKVTRPRNFGRRRASRPYNRGKQGGSMSIVTSETAPHTDALTTEELELARLIVTTLSMDIEPEQVSATAPLYGEGLGLDSIDVLEIALAISKAYGVKLRSDDKKNSKIFSSLRSLSQHIQAQRTP
jgi:acyl carrier protein